MFYFMMIISSLILSLNLFLVTHPISLALSLILYATILSTLLFKLSLSWWFYLLILIFLGGVMILVTYMTTLAANEKFNPFISLPSVIFFVPVLYICISSYFPPSSPFFTSRTTTFLPLYEPLNLSLFLFCLFYLLFTLISVVKIIKYDKGPLSARL